jgi:DNA-binding MarR family transcriptional regulator
MASVTSAGGARRRRRSITDIKESLRELRNELSVLNRHVGAHVDLKDIDMDCLDLINTHGPMSPSALARRAGLHPATVTGVLDRLERGGWIVRERDSADRRAVGVHALRERNATLYGLFAGMNTAMNEICADYDDAELELLADFLRRATNAGRAATEQLASE